MVAWGNDPNGAANVPAAATNVVAIAAADLSSLALRADGTTVGWGSGPVTVPESAYALNVSPPVSGATNTAVGSYPVTYSVTNELGISSTVTRTVVVTDTVGPVVSLLGNDPLSVPMGAPFTDPGAMAMDFCAGDVTSNIVVTGSVNTAVPAPYVLTYVVSDPSGNTGTNSRTVFVTAAPAISGGNALVVGTNPTTGGGSVMLSADVVPNGLAGTAWFQFGLRPAQFANTPPVNLPANYAGSNITANLGGLIPGVTYHYRAGASNSLGITYGPDLAFAIPSIFADGDSNGDGMVDQSELNGALSNYWSASSLYMTNPATLGGGMFQFALTNVVGWEFGVQVSTDLITWTNLPTGAFPVYQFLDPQGGSASQRFYRLTPNP